MLLHRPLMLHAALVFPAGRLPARWAWPLLAASWASAVLLPVGRDPWASLIMAGLIGAAAWRLRTAAVPGRRTHAIVASRSAAFLAASIGVAAGWRRGGGCSPPSWRREPPRLLLYSALVLLAGAALLAGLLMPPERETDAVIELTSDRPTETLAALQHESRTHTDAEGRDSLRAAMELLESNAALQVELSERVDEVRASRRRLVDAAVAERRRLEQVLAADLVRRS